MRICGLAAEVLHGERSFSEDFPIEDLQNYWSSHPHYEDESNISFVGSALEDVTTDEPPPPYTLEADGPPVPPKSTRPSNSSTRPLDSPPGVNVSTRPHHAIGMTAVHSLSPPIPASSKPRASEASSMAALEDGFSRHTISENSEISHLAMPNPSPVPANLGTSQGQWSNQQWSPPEWQSSSSAIPPFPVPETSGSTQIAADYYPGYDLSHQRHQQHHHHHHHHSNPNSHLPSNQGGLIPQFPIPQTSPTQELYPPAPSPAHNPYWPQYVQYPDSIQAQQYYYSQPSTSQFSPSSLPPREMF